MLLLTKLKGHRSNFHYSGPQKAQLVDPEFKIQVTRRVQNIQTRVRTPCMHVLLLASRSAGTFSLDIKLLKVIHDCI